MKNLILILAILFLISSCGGGSSCNSDADGLITENATVYYDTNVGKRDYSISYCYLIKTKSNKAFASETKSNVFIPKTPNSLSKLNIKPNSSSKIKITYRLTGDKLPEFGNTCHHVGRIPIAVIEIICVEKIK